MSRKTKRRPPAAKAELPAWKKALFSAIVFAGFFAALEGVLAVAGVKPQLAYEDPYVGFSGAAPLYIELGDQYVTAPSKEGWFNGQRFPVKKPAGAYRIFSVGGSTTYGRPYDDRVSFSGWLRELLPVADPWHEWEVINAGGVSYASYRVAKLMEELAHREPDLFLIYSGHNEFLERRTYQGLIEAPEAVTALGGLLSRTRIYAAGAKLLDDPPKRRAQGEMLAEEVDTMLAHSFGPEDYERDDEFRKQVLAHYRFNLERMVRIARAAGAEAVLITTAASWKDCSPFKSQPTAGLSPDQQAEAARLRAEGAELRDAGDLAVSLERLDASVALDPRYAETHYERGRTLLAMERAPEARDAFQRAMEEDVCPLRSFPAMNDIVREVARESRVPFLDFDAYVREQADDGIPGSKHFLDHVHLNYDGYRELAMLLVDELERQGVLTKGSTWNDKSLASVRERVELGLDRMAQSEAMHNLARVLGWAGKVEDAKRVAQKAIEVLGDDAEAYNSLGKAAVREGKQDEAMEWFRKALNVNPDHADANTNLGTELRAQGRHEEALPYIQAALRARPGYWEAHVDMGLTLSAQGDTDGAERHFRLAIQDYPASHEAHNDLGVELVRTGRLEEAVGEFQQAIRYYRRYAEAYSNLGEALTQLGRYDEAEREIRKALEIGPPTATMHVNLAVALQQAGRLEEAVESYTRALAMDSSLSGALNNRAIAYLALGRDEEAIADLRQALAVDPQFAEEHPEIREILSSAR